MRRPGRCASRVRFALIVLALAWSAFPIALVVLSSFKQPQPDLRGAAEPVLHADARQLPDAVGERPEFFRALANSLAITLGTLC